MRKLMWGVTAVLVAIAAGNLPVFAAGDKHSAGPATGAANGVAPRP